MEAATNRRRKAFVAFQKAEIGKWWPIINAAAIKGDAARFARFEQNPESGAPHYCGAARFSHGPKTDWRRLIGSCFTAPQEVSPRAPSQTFHGWIGISSRV